jgi:hypothetical protein
MYCTTPSEVLVASFHEPTTTPRPICHNWVYESGVENCHTDEGPKCGSFTDASRYNCGGGAAESELEDPNRVQIYLLGIEGARSVHRFVVSSESSVYVLFEAIGKAKTPEPPNQHLDGC